MPNYLENTVSLNATDTDVVAINSYDGQGPLALVINEIEGGVATTVTRTVNTGVSLIEGSRLSAAFSDRPAGTASFIESEPNLSIVASKLSGVPTTAYAYEQLKDYENDFNIPSQLFIEKWEAGEIKNPSADAHRFAHLHRLLFNQ